MGVTNSNKEVSVGSINCGGSFNVQFLDVFVNVLFAVWSIHYRRRRELWQHMGRIRQALRGG